jgi:L-alanine-DL-glutamate epimerase-like enolase superfamily enzyme
MCVPSTGPLSFPCSIDLLIEVHRRLAPMHAVRVAWLLEPFDPFWYEEPGLRA